MSTDALAPREVFFATLHRVVRLARTFDATNKALETPVQTLVRAVNELVAAEGRAEARLEEAAAYVNRWPLKLDRAGHEHARELRAALGAYGVGAIAFEGPIGPDAVRALFAAFPVAALRPTRDESFAHVEAALAAAGLAALVRATSAAEVATTTLGASSDAGGGAAARNVWSRAYETLHGLLASFDDLEARRGLLVRLRRGVQGIANLLEHEPERALGLGAISGVGDALAEHGLGTTFLALALARARGWPRAALADLGVAAALHCVSRRSLPSERRVPAGRSSDAEEDDDGRRAPEAAAVAFLRERRLDPSLALSLVVAHEHASFTGEPELDEPPAAASRLVGLAHAYDARLRRAGPVHALHSVLRDVAFDPALLLELGRLLGPVPPGSLVLLSDGRLAAVARPGAGRPDRPAVLVQGEASEVVDLAAPGAPSIARALNAPAPPGALVAFYFG